MTAIFIRWWTSHALSQSRMRRKKKKREAILMEERRGREKERERERESKSHSFSPLLAVSLPSSFLPSSLPIFDSLGSALSRRRPNVHRILHLLLLLLVLLLLLLVLLVLLLSPLLLRLTIVQVDSFFILAL